MTEIHLADNETPGEPTEHGELAADARAEPESVLETARRIIATDAAIIHRLGTV